MRAAAALALCLAACGIGQRGDSADEGGDGQVPIVDVPLQVEALAPGTTPMAERVAVIGLLNKRNGIARDLEMKPGKAIRAGDVVVRLRACETTAPWETQKLTGAFLQLDVRNLEGRFARVFSGWVYRETPSLNAVEHPIYDVWPKSCAMSHPESGPSSVSAPAAPSSRSSPPKSGASPEPAQSSPATAPAPVPAATSPAESAEESEDR